jgi:lipopolysaccharide biosynthesis glycosyltransferase
MEVSAPFGFVTACHSGDKFMVQATLASIRHFCSDVPICLLADGDVQVNDLQRQYKLLVLRPRDLSNKAMSKLVAGNYRIKLAAMWEGPFEHYVWLDSDAIVWGDFTPQIDSDLDFQIFWSEVSIPPDAKQIPAWLNHFYFDLEKLLKYDPSFEWRGHPYFSAGVYACRRNFVSFEEWMAVEQWNEGKQDWLFRFGDQGILNYLVHSLAQRGGRKVAMSDLQYLVRHHGQKEIDQDTNGCRWRFPANIKRHRAVHFCGQKPYMHNRRAYSKAFTIARLEHYRKTRGEIGLGRRFLMRREKFCKKRSLQKQHPPLQAQCHIGLHPLENRPL